MASSSPPPEIEANQSHRSWAPEETQASGMGSLYLLQTAILMSMVMHFGQELKRMIWIPRPNVVLNSSENYSERTLQATIWGFLPQGSSLHDWR